MKLAWITALIPLAACGREGFNPIPDAPPPAVLECAAAPAVFDLDPNTFELAAASTTDGSGGFATDAAGAVSGIPIALSATDPSHTPLAGSRVTGIASG